MDNLALFVLSSDNYEECWEPFYKCLKKYWSNHPGVYIATETKKCSYFQTISENYDFNQWTRRIKESLNEVKEDYVILICEDCFIRNYVDKNRIKQCLQWLKEDSNIAMFNFERSFDLKDKPSRYNGFDKKSEETICKISLMCAIWNKKALQDILNINCNPWELERLNIGLGYEYYINSEDYIIDVGYRNLQPFAIKQGKWCKEIVPFFEKENIGINFEKRGWYD